MPQLEHSTTVEAHAKLNLHLRVLAQEKSGYHSLETIFHKLTLGDDVRVTLASPGHELVECTTDVGPMEQNLAFRAARAFCEAARWSTGFDIHIGKRIPAGGGLGGGSADAAATLRALNKLAPNPLESSELLRIAGTLGADVPFLTSSAVMAIAWHRGDRMLALAPLPQRHVVLLVPDFGINTAEAYQHIDEHAGAVPSAMTLSHTTISSWESLAAWASNDFTSAAIRSHPSIESNIAALRQAGATLAGLTGSGSVVFGIFQDFPNTNHLARETQCRVVVTQTAVR